MTNFRKTSVLAGETRYADPHDITHTLRVNVKTAQKVSGQVSLTNVRDEMVETFVLPVTNGTSNGVENASIRMTISCSTQNAAKMRAHAVRFFANKLAAMDDGTSNGLTPEIALVAKSA